MEKKKAKSPPPVTDDLAIVKAAAWAWYQHGFSGRPMAEFDLARSHRPYLPSRYKLEAMKEIQESTKVESCSPSPLSSPSYTDNSLLDHYEIERISRELDYYMEAGSSGRREVVPVPKKKSKNNIDHDTRKKKSLGFWFMRPGRAVCGSKDDVVDVRGVVRRPEKYVRVIRVANCLPRVAHA